MAEDDPIRFVDGVDPEFATGRMRDAISKLFFIERLPGETREQFDVRRRAFFAEPAP